MSRHWNDQQWHAPIAPDPNPYDIYVAADVDALKRENAELRARVAELVHENAQLCEQLDRFRRAGAYEERDYTWMTD